MAQATDPDQDKRIQTFGITPADLSRLKTQADFAAQRLPTLLTELYSDFNLWPEMASALKDPTVHALRVRHWARVATGDIGPGFHESAEALAGAFYAGGVPAHAVAICHFSVLNGILRDLKLAGPQAGLNLFGSRKNAAAEGLGSALTKITWLDLELLMETYGKAEAATRATALRNMAETIEREAGEAVGQVSSLAETLATTAQSMAATAAHTGKNAGEAASAANRTLVVAQGVAGSAEELTASVGHINNEITKSKHVAAAAVVAGQDAQARIAALSQQAQDIGQIAAMIADIAARTNLLALNATIEAARAGEAGKGFAVVAGEVKQLASQTSQSTQQITRQISAVQQATENAAAAVAQIVSTIGQMEAISSSVSGAVEHQRMATARIADTISETAGAAELMATQTGEVRAAAEEADTQADAVKQTAGVMENAIRSLRQAVIRVVRTSTGDVNRRRADRVSVDLPAEMRLQGEAAVQVRVADLSPLGALVHTDKHAAQGTHGILRLESMEIRMAVCASRESGCLHLEFFADEAQQQRLLDICGRYAAPLAA